MDINEVYKNHNKAVHWTVQKYRWCQPDEDFDDLVQVGWEAIVKYQKTYDKDKASLNTWVINVVRTSIFKLAEYNNRIKRKMPGRAISYEAITSESGSR